MSGTAKKVYSEAIALVERALDDAGRAQFESRFPELHRERRQLIELRRGVPNDRLDPANQVVRDLLTTYASVLEEQSQRNAYGRESAISDELKGELERLRPRAARQGLPVLADDLRGFRLGRRIEPSPSPAGRAARPRPRRRSSAT
jgi:hypothetical protein